MQKTKRFIVKYNNFNLILSLIFIVLIWRGIWSLADLLMFATKDGTFSWYRFWGYFAPVILGFLYLYFNDFSLREIAHNPDNEGGNEK